MTKEKLIEAALSIYAEHGYKGTTMKKIADAVGIKAASIYFFYPNKEALLRGVFQKILENHREELQKTFEQVKELPVQKSLTQLIIGVAHYHRNDITGAKAYIQLMTSGRAEFKLEFSEYVNNFEEWLLKNYLDALVVMFPNATEKEIRNCILQVELIANGLFWSTIVYTGEAFQQQMQVAEELLVVLINQLHR